jgi:hypothetical protein
MRPLITLPASFIAFAVTLCNGRKDPIETGVSLKPSEAHALPPQDFGRRVDSKDWSNNLAAKLSATMTDLGAEDQGRQVAGLSTYNERRSI